MIYMNKKILVYLAKGWITGLISILITAFIISCIMTPNGWIFLLLISLVTITIVSIAIIVEYGDD